MKLLDCFMYFDEDLVLDIRLNTLHKDVDKFIISEATRDHGGKKRNLKFDFKNFSKFKDKIEYLVIEDIPEQVSSFKKGWHSNHIRDQFQRNTLERGYRKFDENDLIMISDIDEIPNPNVIKNFKIQNKYACFLQKNFQSKLNLLNINNSYWAGTKICQKKYLKSPQWLRNMKAKKKSFWKIFKKSIQLIQNGGWHFSFLKEPSAIKGKIMSYAHQEFNNPKFTDIKFIENQISKGEDLFQRDIKYEKIDIDDTFPDYIVKNKDKFKVWIM